MRGPALVVGQVIISVLIVGVLLPGVLVNVAAAREPKVGSALGLGLTVVVFVVLRVVWPRPRRD